MKLLVPIKRDTNESISSYINSCNLYLYVFKQILQNKLQRNKILCRKEDLFNEPSIKWTITESNYNIFLIVNTFINQLQCQYDTKENVCYYVIPLSVKCPYTVTSLNKVMRILEYGGYNMMPLNWIRSSYKEFTEQIECKNTNEDNKQS